MWSILSLECPPPFQIQNSLHMYKTALLGPFSVQPIPYFYELSPGKNSNGQWHSISSDSWISQSYLDLERFVWGNRKLEAGPWALMQACTSALLELGTENLILIWRATGQFWLHLTGCVSQPSCFNSFITAWPRCKWLDGAGRSTDRAEPYWIGSASGVHQG